MAVSKPDQRPDAGEWVKEGERRDYCQSEARQCVNRRGAVLYSPAMPLSLRISLTTSIIDGSSSKVVSSSEDESSSTTSPALPLPLPVTFSVSFALALLPLLLLLCVCFLTVTLLSGVVSALEKTPARAPAARSCPGVSGGGPLRLLPLAAAEEAEEAERAWMRSTMAARKKKKRKLESWW